MLYNIFFKLVLSNMEPEKAHILGVKFLKTLDRVDFLNLLRYFFKTDKILETEVMGIKFPTPFGIAAGFDKEAKIVSPLTKIGFGFVEVGTITAKPQPGNRYPRLFRLISDRAIINRMGFNNMGAHVAAKQLEKIRLNFSDQLRQPIIGVNIGKTKIVPLDQAVEDYKYTTALLSPYADYLVVNVSSPNTPGLVKLQSRDVLKNLLYEVKFTANNVVGKSLPIFVKISPDLHDTDIVDVAQIVSELDIAGIIATNTTITRRDLVASNSEIENCGEGGLSGEPLKKRAEEVLSILKNSLAADKIIISVGGVTSAEDVYQRLCAGASLVQGYTGFIYQGPLWARKINRDLAKIIKSRGKF